MNREMKRVEEFLDNGWPQLDHVAVQAPAESSLWKVCDFSKKNASTSIHFQLSQAGENLHVVESAVAHGTEASPYLLRPWAREKREKPFRTLAFPWIASSRALSTSSCISVTINSPIGVLAGSFDRPTFSRPIGCDSENLLTVQAEPARP